MLLQDIALTDSEGREVQKKSLIIWKREDHTVIDVGPSGGWQIIVSPADFDKFKKALLEGNELAIDCMNDVYGVGSKPAKLIVANMFVFFLRHEDGYDEIFMLGEENAVQMSEYPDTTN